MSRFGLSFRDLSGEPRFAPRVSFQGSSCFGSSVALKNSLTSVCAIFELWPRHRDEGVEVLIKLRSLSKHVRRPGGRRHRGDANDLDLRCVVRPNDARPQRRVPALRVTPHDGALIEREFAHLVRRPHRVEPGAPLGITDQIRMRLIRPAAGQRALGLARLRLRRRSQGVPSFTMVV
jgi:hypothetical protein